MYQSFIGLEIHIHLMVNSKIFCGCKAAFGDEPNTNVCPVCMGYPGVLPVLNEEAIKLGYALARALNCELSDNTVFERKNYYYPDLPKNYQISQFESPIGVNGWLEYELNGEKRKVRIHDVHLEEDAGKMIHAGDMSLLDYNRTGYPLLEIVTEPDLVIGEDAEAFLKNFQRIVRYMNVSDGNMEEGSLRCDANVSINLKGKGLGKKVEIKNLNSSRFVKNALNYEIQRQQEAMDAGKRIVQETRLWNENRDVSVPMRQKESSNDYRYFPEPDLPPFRPSDEFLAEIESMQVELPIYRKERLVKEYGISEEQAEFIYDEKGVADYFEYTIKLGADANQVATWMASDIKKKLNQKGISLVESPLTAERLAEMLKFINEGKIHGKIAKQVLDTLFEEDKDPSVIIKENGWEVLSGKDAIEPFVVKVLEDNPKAVEQLKSGDMKPIGFVVGQVMKATSGRAEPKTVQEIIKEKIEG